MTQIGLQPRLDSDVTTDGMSVRGRWSLLTRVLWAAVVALALGVFLASAPVRFSHLLNVAAENAFILRQFGMPVGLLAGYVMLLDGLTMLVFVAIALLIVWRRSDDRMALFTSGTLTLMGVVLTRPGDSLLMITPALRLPAAATIGLGTGAIILFLHRFPDGYIIPRWMRWPALLFAFFTVGWYIVPAVLYQPMPWPPQPLPGPFAVAWIATGLFVQIYRYRRVSSSEQRQQTKWVVFGFAAGAVGFLTFAYLVPTLFPSVGEPSVTRLAYIVLGVGFLYGTLLMLPISIGISMLRYRLWDVDVIVNRTLVYGMLTVTLAIVYVASIILLQTAFQTIIGESNQLVIVVSTLLIAALFQPLRARIQAGIDRRFYRHKYDAEKALAAFSATLRDDAYADMALLTDRLRTILEDTVSPEHTSMCFHASTGFHASTLEHDLIIPPEDPLCEYLLQIADVVEMERIPIDSPAVRRLREVNTVLVVPVISQGKLIGVFALGPHRSGKQYSADDRALLGVLAWHAAPALRVAQLVQELEAEAQALARVEQELRVARVIQQTLIPQETPPIPGWQIAAYYQPARAVGGDFYDFIRLPDDRLVLIIGDVTDTGVPAALVMATTRAILRIATQENLSPNEVLQRTNDLLYPDMPRNMFVTCLYAVLDPTSGQLLYANAGHNLPYRWRNGDVGALRAEGMPIGLMPNMDYEAHETVLAPGETLIFYSDGLVEARNAQREIFGGSRLSGIIGRQSHDAMPASALIDVLLNELEGFTSAGGSQDDDVTLVTLQRLAVAAG